MSRFPLVPVLFGGLLPLLSNAAVNIQTDSISGHNGLAYTADFRTDDLINAGQDSLLSVVSTDTECGQCQPPSNFSSVYLNDGIYAKGGANAAFFSVGKLPGNVVFNLDVSTNTMGYDLTTIRSFMSWNNNKGVLSHQVYTVDVRTVGSADYNQIASVNYEPFGSSSVGGDFETKVIMTEISTGILASGVDSIRFNFALAAGNMNGTVIRELDVGGYATGSPPPTDIVLASPTSRQIVQRDGANVGSVPISGVYTGVIGTFEARAVVRGGAGDNGTTTPWQVIDAVPSGDSFSGLLTGVPAGGWYDIEVRGVSGATNSSVFTIEKVGVGDIFLMAGQSNSVNFGDAPYTPTDDRISVRTAAAENSWIFGQDPLPFDDNVGSGRNGTGGSPWSRFADSWAADQGVPVGIISMGLGSSRAGEWTPGNLFYNTRIRDAVQSLPPNGFTAFFWHQGEANGDIGTSAATYAGFLDSFIDQSRVDAGWDFPWYIAEASALGSSSMGAQEAIVAGQRSAVFSNTNVFLGATTNDFRFTGKVWADRIHFNESGLIAHAGQWFSLLMRTAPIVAANGNFEKNTDTALSGVSPLADDTFTLTLASSIDDPKVFDWHMVSASDDTGANGSNGYFNPGAATYSGAVDSINGGVLPNMDGKHVAVLGEGIAGNYFLQTLRSLIQPNRTYTLELALGVRDAGSGVFGGARVELLAGGVVQGAATFTESDLDTLAGGNAGDASGKFTKVSLVLDTNALTLVGRELAIRIIKVNGGTNTYLDFDNVTLSELVQSASAFEDWAIANGVTGEPGDDFDGDGHTNLLEFAFGTPPDNENHVLNALVTTGDAFRLTRRVAGPANLTYVLQSSPTMVGGTWADITDLTTTPVSSNGDFETVDLTRPSGWSPAVPTSDFFRLKVTLQQ